MNKKLQNLIQKHAEYNRKKYIKFAASYDYLNVIYNPLRNRLANIANITPGAKILDVASGTGEQALAFARQNYDVTGVDLSGDMIIQSKKKQTNGLKLKFIQADATSLPFKTNTFDVSTISMGLHEMPYEIRLQVLAEMKRVTKNKGMLIFLDYPKLTPHPYYQIAFQIVRLYEAPTFTDFVKRGLDTHLQSAGIDPQIKSSYLTLHVRVCWNEK